MLHCSTSILLAILLTESLMFNVVTATNSHLQRNIADFIEAAKKSANYTETTDKVSTHSYQIMYGTYLIPAIQSHKHDLKTKKTDRKFKFFEIGMGCSMDYSPGKSVLLWQYLLGNIGDLWMAEYDVPCVEKFIAGGHMNGFRLVSGDQGDPDVLRRWVKETGGEFDVIIDDGSHKNKDIKATFDVLFNEALRPGGLYFIEDLQVSTNPPWMEGFRSTMSTVIQAWAENLMIPRDGSCSGPPTEFTQAILAEYPMPSTLMWLACQREACVFFKSF